MKTFNIKKALIILLLVMQSIAATLMAQAGTPDSSFDTDGWAVMTPKENIRFDSATDMVLQPDGKIVYICTIVNLNNSKYGWGIVRLNEDGSLDTSFNNNGYLTFYSNGYDAHPYSIALTVDGKIMVSGNLAESDGTNTTYSLTVIRILSNGSFDTSFDGDGILTVISNNSLDYASHIALQSDSKIILYGYVNGFVIMRLNMDGTYDSSFDADGIVNPQINVSRIKLQPDGKIVCAGAYYNGLYNFAAFRYNINGTPDTSFGASGLAMVDFGNHSFVADFEIAPDGKIVLGGNFYEGPNYNHRYFCVGRLNADGSLDTGFDTDGKKIIYESNNQNRCNSIALQTDGKILLGGYKFVPATPNNKGVLVLVRLQGEGSLDTGFDLDGILNINGLNSISVVSERMALQQDGKIVINGNINEVNEGLSGPFIHRLLNGEVSYSISYPTNITAAAIDGSCSAIVNSLDPVVVPSNFTYSYTLSGATTGSGNGSANGLLFNAGTTTVTYTLIEDTTKTCSFTVTVTTNENPQVSWKNISAGDNHTLAIKSDGTLWAWGYNGNGVLGNGTTTPQFRPIQIGSESNWQSISSGYNNSYAIKNDGTLWGWGYLRDGTNVPKYIPTQIGSDTNWILVGAGSSSTFAIKSDGTLWGWGYLGYSINSYIPVQIGNDTGWTSISNITGHFLALKSDGTLWSWGRNYSGQLGDGTTTDRYSLAQVGLDNHWQKIAAGGSNSFAIKTDGTFWGWGYLIGDGTSATKSSPTQIGIDVDWESVSSGNNHVLALKSNGTLWASGNNTYGQFGNGGNNYYNFSFIQIGNDTDWRSITAGYQNSFLIKKCGSLYCATGRNNYGQLGDGTSINRNIYECMPLLVPCIPPQANVGLPATICQGEIITLGAPAVAGNTYEWQGGIYPGSNIEANPIVSPYDTTTYTLIVTNTATGCKNANSVTITVNPIPLAKTGFIKTLCSGNSTTLGAAAVSGNTYSWVSSPAGFNSTSANPLVSPTETTAYTLTETITATGCSKTNSVTITANPTPTVTATASDESICMGENSTLTATGAAEYTWSPTVSLSSDTGATVIATPTTTTTYTVKGIDTNANGWSQTEGFNQYFENQTQTVTINDKAYAMQFNYSDYQLKVYEFNRENEQWIIKFETNFYAFYYFLLCSFTVEGKIYFIDTSLQLWQFDPVLNNLITKANFPNSSPDSYRYEYLAFSADNKGYVISYTNIYNAELGTDTYENQVWEYDPILNTWTQKSNFVGNPRSAGVSFSIGNSGYFGTGVWYNQATDENLSLNDFWEYTPSSDTWIQKANIGNSGRAYAVGFSVGNKGYLGTGRETYDYYSTAKKDFWEYDPNTNIWLQKADLTGIARSQAIGFSDNNRAYVGLGLNYIPPSYGPLQDIWKYESGCVSSSTVTVTVNPMPVANAGLPSPICAGNNITIGATAVVGNTYSWVSSPTGFESSAANPTVSPTITTTYTLTETATGCSKSNAVTITVNPLPVVTLGAYSAVCTNAASFGLTGGSPSGGTYSGNGVSSGSFSPSVAGVGSHIITYTYMDGNGCSNSATSSILVNGPTANAGVDKTVYIGYAQEKCTILSGSATGGLAPYTYLWSTGATTAKINVCPTVATTYTLRVTDANGCYTTDNVVVKAVDITCAKNSVYVCHNNATTCVKTNDVKAHLAHGDYLGTCSNTISFAKNTDPSFIEKDDTFLLYPNPTNGSFTVEVCKNDLAEGAKLQVVNVLGQIIYSTKAFKIEGCIKETIELNNALPVGVYFINLIIGENVETKKLILEN